MKSKKQLKEALTATASEMTKEIFSHTSVTSPCSNCALFAKKLQETKFLLESKEERIADLESSLKATKRVIKDILAEQRELRLEVKWMKSANNGTSYQ